MAGLRRCLTGMILLGWALAIRAAPGYPPEIIPADHKWEIVAGIDGAQHRFVFPDDYPRLNKYPPQVRSPILEAANRAERNIARIREIGRAFYADARKHSYRMIPDSELSLREVVIAVRETSVDPLARHEPIIRVLPAYSRIHVITPKDLVATVRDKVGSVPGLAQKTTLHPVDVWVEKTNAGLEYRRPTRWVRDAFLPGRDDTGKPVVFLPPAYTSIRDLTRNDLDFFRNITGSAERQLRLPIFVRGGNLKIVEHDKRRILLIGEREFRYNEEIYLATTQFRPPEQLMIDVLKEISGASEVVVLPNSDRLFHLDMVVAMPRPGVATIIAPLDPHRVAREDRAVIRRIRDELARIGIRRIDIPTTAARIAAYQSPVNGVAFRDATNGQRMFLLPEFPEAPAGGQRITERIRQRYRDTGVQVLPLEERFHSLHGNTHCVIVGIS